MNSSEREWYDIKLYTSQLVKLCCKYQCKGNNLTPEKIHALCRLTWNYAKWTSATGEPLWILWEKKDDFPLIEDPEELVDYGIPPDVIESAKENYGIVNFYRAYRNSSLDWVRKHHKVLKSLVHKAASIRNDSEIIKLTNAIENLPALRTPNKKRSMSDTRSLLTPLFACLAPNLRFPIINKNYRVNRLHEKLKITNDSLESQVKTYIGLIRQYGLKDALMLDAVSERLAEIVKPQKKIRTRPQHSKLPERAKQREPRRPELKDITDIKYFREQKIVFITRVHNQIVDRLIAICEEYDLQQTSEMNYDFLITNYDNTGRDLLIEVKSSSDRPDLRLAVGQLFDYRRQLPRRAVTDLAILVPDEPNKDSIDYIRDVGIEIMWFTNKTLNTIDGTMKLVTKKTNH